jgi:chemotaxis protein CheX
MHTHADAEVTLQDFENGLTAALREVFATMLNEQVRIISATGVTDQIRLSSIVGFGGLVSGFIGLHLSCETACWIASALLGINISEDDETVRDAVGELGNMVAGRLKKFVSRTEEMFGVSIPSVIEGTAYSAHAPAGARQLLFGVMAGGHRFKVQLVLEAA